MEAGKETVCIKYFVNVLSWKHWFCQPNDSLQLCDNDRNQCSCELAHSGWGDTWKTEHGAPAVPLRLSEVTSYANSAWSPSPVKASWNLLQPDIYQQKSNDAVWSVGPLPRILQYINLLLLRRSKNCQSVKLSSFISWGLWDTRGADPKCQFM